MIHGDKIIVGLVQINNSFENQCYFPYTVGMLQAYALRHLAAPDRFEFLLPIFRRLPVEQAVVQLRHAHVVCFSTYVWNIRLSLAVARALKTVCPEILTVFGGPQIPDRDTEHFLRCHPYVDLACHGEGEHVFLALLEHAATRDWSQVPSVSYMDQENHFVQTPLCERISDLHPVPSPYLTGVFESLINAYPDVQWVGLWETNRGCPFTCAYCDWGSCTKNKIVARDMCDIVREADWFSEHKIAFVFCCDANFSLLARDLDIVKKVAENKALHGFPKALSVQSTKNFTRTSYAIYELMGKADLSKGVSLSLQSVYPATLEAIRRQNIPADIFREAQQHLSSLNIETFTDIILPLPAETYDSFVDGISATLENGQHHRIQFNNLSILPNAVMGDPAYQQHYGFTVVETDMVNIHGRLSEDNPVVEKQQLVVGTYTMPPPDWVRSRVFGWTTSLLHFNKLLQIPLVLLNHLYRVSYRQLLESFTQGYLPSILDEINEFFTDKALAIQQGDVEFCRSPRWLNIWWPADELVMIRLCTEDKLDAFYRESEQVLVGLLEKQGVVGYELLLEEALVLNHQLIKLPFQTTDLDMDLPYNLWEVYRGILKGDHVALNKDRFSYHIDRTTECWDSWEDWCRRVIWWGNKRGAYMYACEPVQVTSDVIEISQYGIRQPNNLYSRGGRHDGL